MNRKEDKRAWLWLEIGQEGKVSQQIELAYLNPLLVQKKAYLDFLIRLPICRNKGEKEQILKYVSSHIGEWNQTLTLSFNLRKISKHLGQEYYIQDGTHRHFTNRLPFIFS